MKKFYINSSDKTDHLNQRYFFNFNRELLKNGDDVKILLNLFPNIKNQCRYTKRGESSTI